VPHETAEAVYRQFWAWAGPEDGPIDETDEFGFLDENGGEVLVSFADVVEGIEAQGLWAFADTNTKTVHYWARPDIDPVLAVMVLAHEIGHCTGEPDPDPEREEIRAQEYGRVAALALRWASQAGFLPVTPGYGCEWGAGMNHDVV
jgi:hypothetical protein